MKIIVISSCSASKKYKLREQPTQNLTSYMEEWKKKLDQFETEAINLYTGKQHKIVIECVKKLWQVFPKQDVGFYILSAEYGLIPHDRRIAPYDRSFSGMSVSEIRERGKKLNLRENFYRITENADIVFTMLGRDYLKALDLNDLPRKPKFVFIGGRESKGLIPKQENVVYVVAGKEQVQKYRAASIYLSSIIFRDMCDAICNSKLESLLGEIGTTFKVNNLQNTLNKLSGREWLLKSKSVWTGITKGPKEKTFHPAQFPVALIDELLSIFTKENDVVLDPFVGSGSTLVSCYKNNRFGIGVDLNKKFIDLTLRRLEELKNGRGKQKVICADSRTLSKDKELLDFLSEIGKREIDFMVTSPPYWDVLHERHKKTVLSEERRPEKYSEDERDLGNIADYQQFLQALREVYSEVYALLGHEKYCVIIVMDVRKGDKVYLLHSDIIYLMEKIGYEYQDLIIWNRDQEYNFLRPIGYPTTFIVNRIHEYLLIFRKP